MNGDAELAAAKRAFAVENAESLTEGVGHIERAAAFGNAEAMAQLAHFVASGVNQQADWDRSLDLLQQAAEKGHAPAQEELRLLAHSDGAPAALRAKIDIRAWIAARPAEIVSPSPRIRTIRAFMSAEECAWVIARGRGKLEPATVYDVDNPGSITVDERTNSAAPFRLLEVDVVMVFLQARMAASVGLPNHWFEPATLLHYKPGQHFQPHYDYLDPAQAGHVDDLSKRGQRIATLLTYLSDDYDGGETDFPRLNIRYRGRTGDLLVFANVQPDGAIDPRTLHQGMPPTRGEKWLLSQWVRDRAPF